MKYALSSVAVVLLVLLAGCSTFSAQGSQSITNDSITTTLGNNTNSTIEPHEIKIFNRQSQTVLVKATKTESSTTVYYNLSQNETAEIRLVERTKYSIIIDGPKSKEVTIRPKEFDCNYHSHRFYVTSDAILTTTVETNAVCSNQN